jgi:glycosyltransferase involved in cell wall biosynthesis
VKKGISNSSMDIEKTNGTMVPRITVIITCYNLGKYLKEAINSVHKQSYKKWELIVVDDGSDEPETLQILKELETEGIGLLRLKHEGVAKARNTAIHNSNSPYVCCLDADDTLAAEYLERTIAVLEADVPKRVAMVTTWMKSFGNESVIYETGGKREASRLLTGNFFHVSSLFRRAIWQESGGYCETLAGYQDWDLWISFLERGYLWETIEEPLFHYRVRSQSMVSNSDRIRPELVRDIVERHRSFFEKNLVPAIVDREERIKALKEELEFLMQSEKMMLQEERERHNRSEKGKLKILAGFAKLDPPILADEEFYLFGTGQMASIVVEVVSYLGLKIAGVFDNDKSKKGSWFFGAIVDLPSLQERRVIVASLWRKEITEQLIMLGYEKMKIVQVES